MAFPKILHHPWGYGAGRSGPTLGFFSPSGQMTVDSYYIRLTPIVLAGGYAFDQEEDVLGDVGGVVGDAFQVVGRED